MAKLEKADCNGTMSQAEAGKNHAGWPDIGAKKAWEKFQDPGKNKKHSRFKQH